MSTHVAVAITVAVIIYFLFIRESSATHDLHSIDEAVPEEYEEEEIPVGEDVAANAPTSDDVHQTVKNLHNDFARKAKDEKQKHLKSIFGTRLDRQVDMPPARKKHFPRSNDPVLEKALGRGEFHAGGRITRTSMPQPTSDAYTVDDHMAFHGASESQCG